MDNNKKLFEGLLKADGIDPANITESERMLFRQMLEREKKRMKHLSWLTVGVMWIFAIAMIGLCVSEKILEALHIPFVVAWIGLIAMMYFVVIARFSRHNRKLKESSRKVGRLEFLVYGRRRGLTLIGKKDGKRFIYWPRIIIFAVAAWLVVSLTGAGLYYLLCQRWIYFLSPIFHIFPVVTSLSFVIFLLSEGLKVPLDELVEVKVKSKQSKSGCQPDIWRIIIKSRITKLAAVTCILAAMGLLLYRYSGNLDGATNAYATVLENIRKAHSVAYKQRIISGKSDNTSSNTINSAGIMRIDVGQGSMLIFDPHNDIQLTLSTSNKKAFVNKHIGRKKRDFNWLTWITEQFSRQGEYQGRKMFQGRFADLYVIDEPFRKCHIWVDPQTQLPIYSEEYQTRNNSIVSPEVDLEITDFGGTGNIRQSRSYGGNGFWESTIIRSDFQWNVDVNDSLFSIEPPPDYNVTEITSNATEPNETDVVQTLKFCVEVNGPYFPESLDILGDPNINRPMLVKKFHEGDDPEKELNAAIEFSDILCRAVVFVQNKKAESNWFYNPQVMPDEADKALCWWKKKDDEGYRVIYGDLSIYDINDMPQ